ncbi:hypothetical protein F5888DRAFT_781851 [Russula emetica]|nr:hypothetical protein F5888DRAFT_781851 [Russula emetica]
MRRQVWENSCIFCPSDTIHIFITVIDLKTAIYGCVTLYKKPHFNMVFTVSFISLRLVIFFDNPRAFVSYVAILPHLAWAFMMLEPSALMVNHAST